MNEKAILVGIFCVLLFVAIFLLYDQFFNMVYETQYTSFMAKPLAPDQPALIIGNTKIFVTKATTTAEITRGLSGQTSLPPQSGMLFIFQSEDFYRFWMPNMRFSLDIIWIGADKKVVDISKNVPPLLDIANPVFYSPRVPARYVLEVNAGFSDAHNINPGDNVQFLSI